MGMGCCELVLQLRENEKRERGRMGQREVRFGGGGKHID